MWNGIQMAEAFYEECGKPMLEREFKPYIDRIAVGLAGQGSECFGYDDLASRDHDYGPGFCLWIPEALKEEIGDELQEAYNNLPVREFILNHRIDMGMAPDESLMTGARDHRVGVHSIEEFYYEHTGITHAPETIGDWMNTETMFLAEAVNGKVFTDPLGVFSHIRSVWEGFYPEDILKKKVAANCGMAGKTGQFNYERCMRRGDIGAAYFCVSEFIHKVSGALYLLNNRYMPYYKWISRGMDDFTVGKEAVGMIRELSQINESEWRLKLDLIEKIATVVKDELIRRRWSKGYSNYLLDHGRNVMKTINDSDLASMNIFVGED